MGIVGYEKDLGGYRQIIRGVTNRGRYGGKRNKWVYEIQYVSHGERIHPDVCLDLPGIVIRRTVDIYCAVAGIAVIF